MIIQNISFNFIIKESDVKKDFERFTYIDLEVLEKYQSLISFGVINIKDLKGGSEISFSGNVFEFFSQLTGGLRVLSNGEWTKAGIASIEACFSFDMMKEGEMIKLKSAMEKFEIFFKSNELDQSKIDTFWDQFESRLKERYNIS